MKRTGYKFGLYVDFIPYFYLIGAIFSLFVLLNVKLLNDSDLYCHPISISIFILIAVLSLYVIYYGWRVAYKRDEEIIHWSLIQKFIVSLLVFICMWILTSVILISFILVVNCLFDSSKPKIVDVEVVSVFRGYRKGGYLCYAQIKKKNDLHDDVIHISNRSYRLLENNKGFLRLYIKKGRLSYPWIVKDSVT